MAAGKEAATVEGYFAKLPPGKRAGLEKLRRALRALLPKAEECISYGIPAFRHADGVVVYYAAMKAHLSFFPTSYPIEACAADLRGYQVSRGTIRFPIDEPLPPSLLKKLVRVRLEQMAAKRAERPSPKTRPSAAQAKPAAAGAKLKTQGKPRLNAAWHKAHRMPRNPKPAERAAWHMAHAKACGCRPMPASVAAWIRDRKPAAP